MAKPGRGRKWFEALTGKSGIVTESGAPPSVLCTDVDLRGQSVRFLCVVPNPDARFPRARDGEVGLDEAFALATYVRQVIDTHTTGDRRPIIAIVDVKSQAYGRREETAAIYHAAATAADAYATARTLGHPVITLVVGQALSGGFLTHGYQANRIIALDDPGVVIHAMHKEAAARVTKRTVEQLDELAKIVVPISYDIKDYARLGLLHELLQVSSAADPQAADVEHVQARLLAAIEDARVKPTDLSERWTSETALATRKATIATRQAMFDQWDRANSCN